MLLLSDVNGPSSKLPSTHLLPLCHHMDALMTAATLDKFSISRLMSVLYDFSSFRVDLPLRRVRMMQPAGCLTFALTRRSACTHMTTSFVASLRWHSQRAAD